MQFGRGTSFGNAGMFQNQWEYGTSLNWVKGRHTLAFGMSWDHTQLNIINHNTNTDNHRFQDLPDFVEGTVRTGIASNAFTGSASRYYRSDTAGAFVNDNYKVRSNLTVTLGLRWDFDGPLVGKIWQADGVQRESVFLQRRHRHDHQFRTRDRGNNPFGTPGASNSLMKQHQWGFAPRIGIAWTPTLEADRARRIRHLLRPRRILQLSLAQRRRRLQRPVRRHAWSRPSCSPSSRPTGATFATPVRNYALLPSRRQRRGLPGSACQTSRRPRSDNFPAGNLFGPFLFGGYDINNKLPYTENWTFDLQYQASNSWLFSAGYVGNHGVHEILPIPFNQPQIATPQHPVNGQIYSYGGVSPNYRPRPWSRSPPAEYAGNAPIRVPYVGYDMNSVLFKAEGISNYDALQLAGSQAAFERPAVHCVLHLVARAGRTKRPGTLLHRQQPAALPSRATARRISIRPTCS